MPDKAVFLDRDNTLIDDPGYINNPDQVKLLEGVPEALNGSCGRRSPGNGPGRSFSAAGRPGSGFHPPRHAESLRHHDTGSRLS